MVKLDEEWEKAKSIKKVESDEITFIYDCENCGTVAKTKKPIFECPACNKSNKVYKNKPNKDNSFIDIELPGNGVLVSNFAKSLVGKLNDEKTLFYRQDSREIVELGGVLDSNGKISHTGFLPIIPSRFITLIEKYFSPWEYRFSKGGQKFRNDKSMNSNIAKTVLDSHIFEFGLPNVNRIFTVQTPIIYNGDLTFPKVGYDDRFNSWTEINAPKISNPEMKLEEAKTILYNLFNEFCFESKKDYINAISALLTPLLRGIYKTGFNTRTPVYAYMANRERSGKDYLAGVTGLLYEGVALEEPPISNGERGASSNNDELRKKIISAMRSGKKRLHFSNNKGHLNNSVLESVTTASRFSDRLLGKNQEVTFDNEIEFSFSGNLGITLTPDLSNRTLFINLFLDLENANERRFNNPILHKWVKENRNLILSALYSLVKNWFDNDCKNGSIPFASFPEWARVCGGIMECANYDNPCKKDTKETGVSIDSETEDMKELFEACYNKNNDIWLSKLEIRTIINERSIMSYLDFNQKRDQTKFGIRLNKFVGRILSDVRLIVEDKTVRPARWKYKFTKNEGKIDKKDIFGEESGNLGKVGNLSHVPNSASYSEELKSMVQVTNVTKVTKL